MLITSFSPAQIAGKRFKHGSNFDGKTFACRVSSQWKSTARACIEQCIGRIKRFKRVALRREKTAQNF